MTGFVIYKKAPEAVRKVLDFRAKASQAVPAAPSPDAPAGETLQPVH